MIKHFFMLLIFTGSSLSRRIPRNTLEQVHVIFRHGDRNPVTLYPKDPNINDTWSPEGLGQLTNYGKMQEYDIGRSLRERYNHFLDDIYNIDLIEPISIDLERNKMSLALALAGLFPPVDSQVWNDLLPWQPIPYNYVPWDEESIMQIPIFFCQKYIDEFNKVFQENSFQSFMESNSDLIRYISDNTGLQIGNLKDLFDIYNTLNSEVQTGRSIPEWTKKVFPEFLENAGALYYDQLTHTTELRKFSGGKLIQKILGDARAKQYKTLSPGGRKIFMYSGSEYNVAYTLGALNIFDPHPPPYGSYILIEVHNIRNIYGFKILYQDYKDSFPQTLTVPGCDTFCPIERFALLTESIIPDESDTCE